MRVFPLVVQAISLLEYAAAGHRRSQLWLVKLLGQIIADKALADAAADRQGASRASMTDFLPVWSLNRCRQGSHQGILSMPIVLSHAASICGEGGIAKDGLITVTDIIPPHAL